MTASLESEFRHPSPAILFWYLEPCLVSVLGDMIDEAEGPHILTSSIDPLMPSSHPPGCSWCKFELVLEPCAQS